MKIETVLRGYDYDLPLHDALNGMDPFTGAAPSESRRLLAGAAIGTRLDTACFNVRELLEAVSQLNQDHSRRVKRGEGYVMLEEILEVRNPLTMRFWYLVCDLHIGQATYDLSWLMAVLGARAGMYKAIVTDHFVVAYEDHDQRVKGPTVAQLLASVPSAFRRG